MNGKMLFFITGILFLFSFGFSVSNEEIREIMDKSQATVSDAYFLMMSADNPDFERTAIDLGGNRRLEALKIGAGEDVLLDAGSFAIIAIELKKSKGGLLYLLTGFSKFAADSLIFNRIYPSYFSWNRPLSGKELMEFVSAIKDNQQ